MKTNFLKLTTALCVLAVFNSCKDEVYCTEEFRTISITVNGPALDDFYTLRESTGDTLIINHDSIWGNAYPVLDDNFQKTLEDKTETFRFHGIINDSIVVNEPFVIKADKCHIIFVSGKQEVNL